MANATVPILPCDNEEAYRLFPYGTKVRLSQHAQDVLGGNCIADHGVGYVCSRAPKSPQWDDHGRKVGGCVMVRWPESRVPRAVVPAALPFLEKVPTIP